MRRTRTAVHRAGRRRRTVAGRVRASRPQACRRRRDQDRRDRQPQRLSGGDAGGELADPAHARIAAISEPPGAATFMTVAQHGLVGDMKAPVDVTYLADTVILLRYFEALGTVRRAISIIKKRTGAHESTIREYRIDSRGLTIGEPLERLPGRAARRSGLCRREEAAAGGAITVKPGASSERAVILAPTGRDAAVAAALIGEAGYYANVCSDLAALLREIEGGAGLAVIADEAIKTADLRGLVRWLNGQPSWSDFPIVLADPPGRRSGAQSGCGAARTGARQRHLHRAAVSSDHAGQHRRLRGPRPPPPVSDPRDPRGPHRKRRPAADGAERRPSRRAGTASAGVRTRGLRHLQELFRTPAGAAVLVSGFAGIDSSRRSRPPSRRCSSATIKTGKDYSDRVPQHLARRLAALGRRPRPRGAPA